MKNLILSTALLFIAFISYSQSISGNLGVFESEESLRYGNVDIYQGDVLVASVLTDAIGNFNVALDTGTYVCVVNFAGYKEIRKTIHVESDEKSDFKMKSDPMAAKAVLPPPTSEPRYAYDKLELADEERVISGEGRSSRSGMRRKTSSEAYYSSSIELSGGAMISDYRSIDYGGSSVEGGKSGVSGALTAGEINDFSKWELWKDLAEGELKTYETSWEFIMAGRYTIQLQNKVGLPLADAIVKLKNGSEVLFVARTDNTGKAELWASTKQQAAAREDLKMEISYMGILKTIENAKPFSTSINYATIDVDCNSIQNVDIAFVVDATGSMGDELSYLKAEMNDVIYKSKMISSKLNFRFANVFYRDQGPEEYLTKTMDFSRILSESVSFVNSQNAGGGGDYEEAVEIALDSAINTLSWSEEARTRILFLILDAPPHNTPENREKLQGLIHQAAEKGIRIVPVGASGINKATEYLMRAMALGTNGTYTFLTNHSGIGNAHIEPSTDEYKVESFNDIMVRILKTYTYMPDCEQNLPDLDLPYSDSMVVFPNIVSDTIIDTLASVNDSIRLNPEDSLLAYHDSIGRIDPQNDPRKIVWSYFPNPTNGIINIKSEIDILELYITDLSGKVLQIIKNLEKDRVHQVDLSSYVTGIYLLRYPHEDNWLTGKVVLHR